MKNTERFSVRVENYVRYRPHYPPSIIPFLKKEIGLEDQWVVADIGSGTGLSSELFLKNGNRVFAVEPNKEMRSAAEKIFKNEKNFVSINAAAEETSLKDGSVDLILAGQAFHWFDRAAAKKEFVRVAKSPGYLLLLWNDRKLEAPFQKAYEKMLLELAPSYDEVCQRTIDEAAIRDFFAPRPFEQHSFSNAQEFDFESLKGRLLSCSYAPLEHQANYNPIMQKLHELFEHFKQEGKVQFAYDCKLYYGKIK